MTRKWLAAVPLAAAGLLALPGVAFAQTESLVEAGAAIGAEVDLLWTVFACVLVLFMQAGFMFLEIGFSRGKNVGTGVAKVFVNFGILTLVWWAVGNGIAGDGNKIFGTGGENFFFNVADGYAAVDVLFGLAFAAVSLAIVWGTTLERIKFGAYVAYTIVFGAVIYPLIAHGVWADGLLADIGGKPVLDFAGSSVVHLTGATAGFVACVMLGARKGKFGPDGEPRAIPGHSMPLVGLGVIILWIGWFGFNAGTTVATEDGFFGLVALNTQLAAAGGAAMAALVVYIKTKAVDVGMVGNGAIAGLVGITAPCAFVDPWAAVVIGLVAGIVVVFGVLTIERYIDDPVGATSAHGLAGIWGTLAVGIFGTAELTGVEGGSAGVFYGLFDGDVAFSPTLGQLAVQGIGVAATFAAVLVLSYVAFAAIRATIGLRAAEEDEIAGLDISSHGMYGYPEQFIPQPEYPMATNAHVAGTPVAPNGE